MSTIDYRSKRQDINKIRKLIAEIMRKSPDHVSFSPHAYDQMKERKLIITDVFNILHSPDSRVLKPGEHKDGSYRYQYGTNKIVVVISFWPNGKGLNIVSAWRKG